MHRPFAISILERRRDNANRAQLNGGVVFCELQKHTTAISKFSVEPILKSKGQLRAEKTYHKSAMTMHTHSKTMHPIEGGWTNKNQYLQLAKLAMAYICGLAMSVWSENVFSTYVDHSQATKDDAIGFHDSSLLQILHLSSLTFWITTSGIFGSRANSELQPYTAMAQKQLQIQMTQTTMQI